MRTNLILILAGTLLLAGCDHSEYDMPDGLLRSPDKEITLF